MNQHTSSDDYSIHFISPNNPLDYLKDPEYSNHHQEYQQYFKDVQSRVNQKIAQCNNSIENKMKHKIITMEDKNDLSILINFNKARVLVIGSQFNGLVIKYQVLLGNFKISVDMINQNTNAPNHLLSIGQGSYGQVFMIPISKNKNIACKRTRFKKKTIIWPQDKQIRSSWQIKANIGQIHEVILQYSIYRICSFYKIGPSTVDCMGFDLVCFNDAIQFYMQHCSQQLNSQNYENELKICLRILHKMKLIHKDIKPSNILYSQTQQSYVLTDFGISHPVSQQPGELTQTYKQGTSSYMSIEMFNLENNKSGLIDLYYNDLVGLQTSFIQMYQVKKNRIQKSKLPIMNKRVNIQYMTIKVMFMILNSEEQNTIEFIKENNLYIVFFEKLKYLQIHSIKYNKIHKMLILHDQKFLKYHHTQVNQLSFISQKNLVTQQIQFMIRAYGMTHQLVYELKRFEENWRIKKIIDCSNIITMQIPTIEQLNITAKQFWFIKSQEKYLYIMRGSHFHEINYNEIVNISFIIFYFYIQFPIYHEHAKQIFYQISQQQLSSSSKLQKVQYQFISIILQLIQNKQKYGHSHHKKILEMIQNYPQQILFGYSQYFKVICWTLMPNHVIKQYELFMKHYKVLKLTLNQVKSLIEIKLRMIELQLVQYPKNYTNIIRQLQVTLKQYNLESVYEIEIKMMKGKYFLKCHRIKLAIPIFEQLMDIIKQKRGQNQYKLITCKICLSNCYFVKYQLEKSEIYLLQCTQQISQLYGQRNKDFIKCLMSLIRLYINNNEVSKVIMYYKIWCSLIDKVYPEYHPQSLKLNSQILAFYFKSGLIEDVEKIIQTVQQKYKNKGGFKHCYYLQILSIYYNWKFDYKKSMQIQYENKIIHQQLFQQQNLYILKSYAEICYLNGTQYYEEAQKIFQFIISRSQKNTYINIQSIYQLGILYFNKKDYKGSYNYFNQAVTQFIYSQIDNLPCQLKYKFDLCQCLIQLNQFEDSLKILLEINQKSKKIRYYQENYLLKHFIAKCYCNLRDYDRAKRIVRYSIKNIKLLYPNIKKLCIEKIKFIVKYKATYVYPLLIDLLCSIYHAKKMYNHVIYYNNYFYVEMTSKNYLSMTNAFRVDEISIYTSYFQKYKTKKLRALKHELLYIESLQIDDLLCYKHCMLIKFYSNCREKTSILILLTFLLEKVCKCERAVKFVSFYKMFEKGFKYRVCNEIVKTGKLNLVKNKEKVSAMIKKITLLKKMNFLNRKLRLTHKLQVFNEIL